jgi:hypothetical protein
VQGLQQRDEVAGGVQQNLVVAGKTCSCGVPAVKNESSDVDGHDIDTGGRVGIQGRNGPQPVGGLSLGAGEAECGVQDQAGVAKSAGHGAVQFDVIWAVDAIGAAGVPVITRCTCGGAIHSIRDDRLGAEGDVGIVAGGGELIAADLDDKWKVGVWVVHRSRLVMRLIMQCPTDLSENPLVSPRWVAMRTCVSPRCDLNRNLFRDDPAIGNRAQINQPVDQLPSRYKCRRILSTG